MIVVSYYYMESCVGRGMHKLGIPYLKDHQKV
jgi:hypothetical protein